MKTLLALVVCLLVVLAPFTVVVELGAQADGLPWKTFSESAQDAIGAGPAGCGGEVVLQATLVKDGKTWLYFTAENGRFVFAETNDAGAPVRIYVGKSLPNPDHDKINVTDEHPYSEDRDGLGPCPYLFPKLVVKTGS